MLVNLGVCAKAKKEGRAVPVGFDSKKAVNPHWLLLGTSGAGKTHNLRKIIAGFEESATNRQELTVHVMDGQGDINIPGASNVTFSEQTSYGLNPLRVVSDPHFGGVRKRVQGLIETMNRVMRQLGGKQEACLRNILYDLYELHGFKPDDPTTWKIKEDEGHLISDGSDGRLYLDIPITEKDQAKALAPVVYDGSKTCWWIAPADYKGAVTRWPPKRAGRTHPTIEDALKLARRILEMQFMGSDQDSITNLEIYSRSAAAYTKKVDEYMRKKATMPIDEREKFEADLDKKKAKAMGTLGTYLDSIRSGRELEEVMRYDSIDVLKSVIERLENLHAKGLCKRIPPPFDPNTIVWRYLINAFSREEKKLFVFFKLEEIYSEGIRRGEQKEILDVIVLDEASTYADDDPDNIVNIIIREGRKFGIALVAASQNPTHFSDDFLSLVGTKVILGVDELYWKWCASKMQVAEAYLKWIRLRRSLMVQFKTTENTETEWRAVLTEYTGP